MLIPQYPSNVHETEIGKVLALQPAAELAADACLDIDLSVFICFTNRTGSNYLAELLRASGELPEGKECFNHPTVARVAGEHDLKSLPEYCRHVARRVSRKRRFVCKASAGQLFMLARLGYLGTVFPNPRFIHIQRYDVVAQAISYHIAKSTRVFASFHTAEKDEGEVEFDADGITRIIQSVERANEAMRDFLLLNRLDHMPVLYENLCEEPRRVVGRIFAWLGFDRPVLRYGQLRYRRQDSSVKQDWYQRYVAERCEAGKDLERLSLSVGS